MRRTVRRLAVLLGVSSTLAAGLFLPDPSPGGPQRPYEPDVEGPRNIDSLEVTSTALGPEDQNGYRPVSVAFDRRSQSDSDGAPAGARRFVFLFDPSIRFRPDAFPTCARSVVEQSGVDACPQGSLVGSGLGTFYPDQTAEVFVVNTRLAEDRRGLLVVIPAGGVILEQTFEPVSLPYRSDYRWAIDEIVLPDNRPPEERPGTVRFQLEFGAPHPASEPVDDSTVGFVETRADIGDSLDFGLWSEFVTGQRVLPESTATLR